VEVLHAVRREIHGCDVQVFEGATFWTCLWEEILGSLSSRVLVLCTDDIMI
jgi:transposase-like protein